MREVAPIVLQSQGKPGCDLTVRYGFEEPREGLNPFWAQRQIGSDLAKDFLKTHRESMMTTKVSNIDLGYNNGSIYAPTIKDKSDAMGRKTPPVMGTYDRARLPQTQGMVPELSVDQILELQIWAAPKRKDSQNQEMKLRSPNMLMIHK